MLLRESLRLLNLLKRDSKVVSIDARLCVMEPMALSSLAMRCACSASVLSNLSSALRIIVRRSVFADTSPEELWVSSGKARQE